MTVPLCPYHAGRVLAVVRWLDHLTNSERRAWLETYARSCSAHCDRATTR